MKVERLLRREVPLGTVLAGALRGRESQKPENVEQEIEMSETHAPAKNLFGHRKIPQI